MERKIRARYLNSKNFDQKLPDNLDIVHIQNNNWIIDDIDKLIIKNDILILKKDLKCNKYYER